VAGLVVGVTVSVSGAACQDSTSTGKTPKKIFEAAKNGDKFFQVYGFGLHLKDAFKRSDKGVDLAAWGKETAANALARFGSIVVETMRSGMTETEFYYDESGPWKDYKDDALWNLKWRARLRRYRAIPAEIRALAPANIAQQLETYLTRI